MQRRRKLNIPAVKGAIMFVLGWLAALLSAISGIGPQIAIAPMISFLLGYNADKCQGTALGFAFFASLGGIVGLYFGNVHVNIANGFVIAIGATVGAAILGRKSSDIENINHIRIGQTLAIGISLFVIADALRSRFGGPNTHMISALVNYPGIGLLVFGLVVGVVAHRLQIVSGVLITPGLIYFAGMHPAHAVGASLTVIAIASLLPVIGYASRQLVDTKVGTWLCLGGFAGGIIGGHFLSRMAPQAPMPYVVFGLCTMILAGWTLSRLP